MDVYYCHTYNIWADVLNNPKQGKVFRYFRGELINLEVDYDNEVERENITNRVSGVLSEESNEFNKVHKRLSYSKTVQT